MKITKEKLNTIKRICVSCGKKIKVILYKDRTYRGGHFFGKLQLDKERAEYWECPKCYW